MDPVSATEFQAAIGEIRRRSDERHSENVERMRAIEREFKEHTLSDVHVSNSIRNEIARNTELTESAVKIAQATQASVEGLVQFMTAANVGKKLLLSTAAVLLAFAAIWGAVLYIIGLGPLPGPHI